jgi:nucleoid DNA-binding protein
MIDINHEIRSLLFDHDYVTVPGFGAFIAHYEPSVYNSENNSFSPPNRKISFNSVLKQDDGLLMSTLMKKRSLSTQKAKEVLFKYVQEIKNKLVSNDVFEFSGIGELELSKDQKVVFSPALSNFYNESYGFDTLYSFNNSNFTYSKKYFENSVTSEYELDTMNISMSKIGKKPFYTKFLYALPLVVLIAGLVSVLVFNPSTSENANSSLNPVDYVDSVKSWFAEPTVKSEIVIAPKFAESIKVEKSKPAVVAPEKLKLIVGVFSESSNVNKLYNKLVLNNLSPQVTTKDDKSIIHINVTDQAEASTVSDKLEQLIGERGVLLKK